MGELYQNDLLLMQEMFKECSSLRGITVKYYSIKTVGTPSLYGDPNDSYNVEVKIDIMLDQYPQIRTLKRLGWFKEDDENLPILAYLPFDAPDIKEKCRLAIPSPIGSERLFEITNLKEDLMFPSYWVCKLAPVIVDEAITPDYDENYQYIDVEGINKDLTSSDSGEVSESSESGED